MGCFKWVTTIMTQEQKLLVNFNCCLTIVNNKAIHISLSLSIKQQGIAVAIKLSI